MTTVNLVTLASLLTIGELEFSYTTKEGKLKTTKGKDGDINANGNLTYFDIIEDGWRTVFSGSTIKAKLSKNDHAFQIPAKVSTAHAQGILFGQTRVATVPSTPANNTSITTDTLQDLLVKSVVKFEYIKSDGTLRVAYGTADNNRLPANIWITNSTTSAVVNYFDIEKQSVRSVSKGAYVKLISTMDVPLKK